MSGCHLAKVKLIYDSVKKKEPTERRGEEGEGGAETCRGLGVKRVVLMCRAAAAAVTVVFCYFCIVSQCIMQQGFHHVFLSEA